MTMRITSARIAALLCCAGLVVTGCASSDSGSTEASSPPVAPESAPPSSGEQPTDGELQAMGDVEVDQGLLSVTVTLPADFAEDVTQADIEKSISQGDIQDGQINEDGTVTYQLSKSQHEESLSQLRSTIDDIVAEENTTNPGLYGEVSYNDQMTEFRVVVADKQKYEQSMSMLTMGLIFGAGFYQIFYGVPEDQRNVVIEYIDEATGEVFDTHDARKEMS